MKSKPGYSGHTDMNMKKKKLSPPKKKMKYKKRNSTDIRGNYFVFLNPKYEI